MTSPTPTFSSSPLKFSLLSWHIDRAFWFTLSSLKLDSWKLDSSPKSTAGFYSTPIRPTEDGVSGLVEFNGGAFDETMIPDGYAMAKGWTCNFNTVEEYRTQGPATAKLLQDKYLEMIKTNPEEVLRCPALLTPFNILCFADLKKYTFDHQLSFPTLPSKWTVSSTQPVDPVLIKAVEEYIVLQKPEQRGFFVALGSVESGWKVGTLENITSKEFAPSEKCVIGYINSSSDEKVQGQPLQSLLSFFCLHPKLYPASHLQILSYRRYGHSSLLTLSLAEPVKMRLRARWEADEKGHAIIRRHNLSTSMDPKRRIAEARELNNNLMRWRVAEGLDLDIIRNANVAILGMGTLGCGVVRTLMGWGVQKFKIVDNGVVSFSNPARQSFYTYEDCLSGETLKVTASAAAMAKIDPGVQVEGYALTIPMPDHPNSLIESDYNTFLEIIKWSDVVFSLLDTREARWFPTLVCTAFEKLVINAAVGFDSFVVMRHGLPKQPERLGCYFCSDIVSPHNSTDNATLDQQCTVTRPGIANITASIAVELYVSVLQHPLRALAPTPNSAVADPAFGATPHQIRGHLSIWEQQCLSGVASEYCAGCGDKVVDEWKVHGMEFVKRVCQRGGGMLIERVSGLEEVKKGFEEGWDGGDGDGEDDWEL